MEVSGNNFWVEILVIWFFKKYYGRVLTIDGLVNGSSLFLEIRWKISYLTLWQGGQGESNLKSSNKVLDEFVYMGCGCDPLTDFLYVPRNDTLKNMQGIFLKDSSMYQPTSRKWKFFKYLKEIRDDQTLCRTIISSLVYLVATRHDLMFTRNLLLRFVLVQSQDNFCVPKQTVRYMKGIFYYDIILKEEEQGKLMACWAGILMIWLYTWFRKVLMEFNEETSGFSIFWKKQNT